MNPNLSNSLFKQEELPGMPEPKLKKTSVSGLRRQQKYDPGPDHPRFSAMAGQGVLDFEDRVGKLKPGGGAAGLLDRNVRSRMEVDKYGFVSDPTIPIAAYDVGRHGYGTEFEETGIPYTPRLIKPDEPQHTLQASRWTDKANDPTSSVEALRHLPEEQWKSRPLVLRTENRDVVIDGHHRIGAARRRGEGKVTVDYFDADAAKFDIRKWQDETTGYEIEDEPWPSDPTSSAFEPRSVTPSLTPKGPSTPSKRKAAAQQVRQALGKDPRWLKGTDPTVK